MVVTRGKSKRAEADEAAVDAEKPKKLPKSKKEHRNGAAVAAAEPAAEAAAPEDEPDKKRPDKPQGEEPAKPQEDAPEQKKPGAEDKTKREGDTEKQEDASEEKKEEQEAKPSGDKTADDAAEKPSESPAEKPTEATKATDAPEASEKKSADQPTEGKVAEAGEKEADDQGAKDDKQTDEKAEDAAKNGDAEAGGKEADGQGVKDDDQKDEKVDEAKNGDKDSSAADEKRDEPAPQESGKGDTKPSPETSKKKNGTGRLSVGDSLPDDLMLKNESDEEVNVSEVATEKGVVFFMYPKANTPGCTKQACGFRDNFDDIEAAGYTVYGLSTDNPKPQSTWKTKQNLPFHLLCDPQQKLIKAFGAAKSPSGTKRSHVIVAKGGVIEDMQIQVSPGDSVQRAVDFVKGKK